MKERGICTLQVYDPTPSNNPDKQAFTPADIFTTVAREVRSALTPPEAGKPAYPDDKVSPTTASIIGDNPLIVFAIAAVLLFMALKASQPSRS